MKINLTEIIATDIGRWNPKIIGESQGHSAKYVVFQGKAVRPAEAENELFVVLQGRLVLASGNCFTVLNPEKFVLVPKDIEYKAIAFDETHVMICSTRSSTQDSYL